MPISKPQIKPPKRPKTFATMFSSSYRLTLTYVVLVVWIALAVFAILVKSDLYALAVYFTSGLPVILGYLWAQTSRPSPDLRDAAEMVKSIRANIPQNYNPNPTPNPTPNPIPYPPTPNPTPTSDPDNQSSISIYSDNATIEIKVNQNQLTTLMNTGYVDTIAGKYTFKTSLVDQIKSLIGDTTQDPKI